MKVSLNWLNKYIDLKSYDAQQIADDLTNLGLEVEEIETISPLQGQVIAALILSVNKHPNADNLNVCELETANGNVSVVCGAPNVTPGIKVPLALPGSVLPGEIKIKAGKIRGEKSQGMICSPRELQISQDHSGIMILPESTAIGEPIDKLLSMTDTVLTLGLTPNRPDWLGVIGIARELAAKLGLPLSQPTWPTDFRSEDLDTHHHLTLDIENDADCGRFTALSIKNAKPIPSPLWMQRHLAAVGQRPINLIVDATNYVMLETGHPIHAYDERHLAGNKIIVRRAKEGEKIKTLDGTTRHLSNSDLLICDNDKPIGLAGIMGGENSEVNDRTENIIIEVAHFHPSLVRKTSKTTGLHTDASHRFERGVNIDDTDQTALRVAHLIFQCSQEHAQGKNEALPIVAGKMIDYYPKKFVPPRIAVRLARTRKILGLPLLSQNDCINYLQALGCGFLDKTEERTLFEIPSFRLDLHREIDLIEEIARLHGYENIQSTLPMMEISGNREHPFIAFCDDLKASTAQLGFNEIISFPFVSQKDLSHSNITPDHPLSSSVVLENPVSEPENLLQPTVAINLIKALCRNRRFGEKGLRLFESAKCFLETTSDDHQEKFPFWQSAKIHGHHFTEKAKREDRPIERNRLAGIIDQPLTLKSWFSDEKEADFYDGKSIVNALLATIGIRSHRYIPVPSKEIPWLHPGKSAGIFIGKESIGYVGSIHPKTCRAFGLDFTQPPVLFELDVDSIFKMKEKTVNLSTSLSKFPPTTRDLAFIFPQDCSYQQIHDAISGFDRQRNLRSWRLFDVYQGEPLNQNQKSMAFTFFFSSDKRTLTDKEVEAEVDLLKNYLNQKLSAQLR